MTLIKCKECGEEVSRKSKVCPHCGAKVRRTFGCLTYGALGFLLLLLIAPLMPERRRSDSTESGRSAGTRAAARSTEEAGTGVAREEDRKKSEESVARKEKYIPGLVAADVYLNFTKRGYSLETSYDPPFEDSGVKFPGQRIWRCKRVVRGSQELVEIFGRSAQEITLVRGIYMGARPADVNSEARVFLGFLASIPYDGSQPEEAKAWVLKHVGRHALTTIGGVKFELTAVGHSRMLQLTPISE